MKRIVYLVIKSSPEAVKVLDEIRNEGYNATVMSTESLRHALEELPEERSFFTLRHAENVKVNESILCLFITDEEKVERLKEVVRKYTGNFKKVRGFMYSKKIEDFEGSI